MREGSGWILRAKEAARLRRPDLLQLFEKTILGPANQPVIQVGFAARGVVEELALDVLDLAELPSRVAGDQFRKLIEAKQASRRSGGEHDNAVGTSGPCARVRRQPAVRARQSDRAYEASEYG